MFGRDCLPHWVRLDSRLQKVYRLLRLTNTIGPNVRHVPDETAQFRWVLRAVSTHQISQKKRMRMTALRYTPCTRVTKVLRSCSSISNGLLSSQRK